MLTEFFANFKSDFALFNLFQYITFRTFVAFLTSAFIYFAFGNRFIRFLKSKQFGQIIREDGPATHLKKQNTPTMGGALVLLSIIISVLLWANLSNPFVWVALFLLTGFAAIGLIDDLSKILKKNSLGFRGHFKIVIELGLSLAAALYLYGNGHLSTELHIPFFKNLSPDLGVFYLFFAAVVIIGTANAVNLTDGLDGLVAVPAISSFLSYGVLAYASGHLIIADYLQVTPVVGAGEISIICGAAIGALFGFLWFNTHPAEIFMGDVGSLGIGALLGSIALMAKNEILLILIGGIFVLETVSVITQVVSFKLTGKRIFRMAPLHHHYELKGWPEPKVIVRFWMISFLLAILALSTLKLR
jgi:phospho-N-acetylmuramoyl-pentapeptide-transferase